jgi:hypothetical protein
VLVRKLTDGRVLKDKSKTNCVTDAIFNLVLQYEQKQAINYLHRNSCMYLGFLKNSHASIQITIRIQSKYVFACCRYFQLVVGNCVLVVGN